MSSHHPRVGVGAFVLESSHEDPSNPRFLIGKRKTSHGAGTLSLPGGHLEWNEEIEPCAARETLEETGLIVDSCRFLTATNEIMKSDDKHYVTFFVVCKRVDESHEPRNLEPEKHEDWMWMSWTEMLHLVNGNGEMRLFQPLRSLVETRPDVIPRLGS